MNSIAQYKEKAKRDKQVISNLKKTLSEQCILDNERMNEIRELRKEKLQLKFRIIELERKKKWYQFWKS